MNIFEATHIEKKYAGHKALDNVTVKVPKGSIYGLLGPNGAGKTTLIRIINQITAPDSGTLFFEGRPLRAADIYHIGYLPEERGLYKKMKVGEQALYLCRLKGVSKQDAMSKLKFWFKKFGIEGWWNKRVEELSKGMQQKVQFIVTILHNPRLLIFDEPFSGFDPINVDLLKTEILALKQQGTTIIFSTHDMASVEELCDHITLINKAKVILQGNISEIKETYKANLFRVGLKGDPDNLSLLLNGSYDLKEVQPGRGHFTATIHMAAQGNRNALLAKLMECFDIESFNELLPGMNEIFIRAVKDPKNS